jgi:hypothetical protein
MAGVGGSSIFVKSVSSALGSNVVFFLLASQERFDGMGLKL